VDRVSWTALVDRADWRRRGVEALRLSNVICTEAGYIQYFGSVPLVADSVLPLGDLWRPGSTPDRPPARWEPGKPTAPGADRQATSIPIVGAVCLLLGTVVLGVACARCRRAQDGGMSHALINQLARWQRQRYVKPARLQRL
jgi:hypothetical protein